MPFTQKATKAQVGAVASALVAGLGSLISALDDNAVSPQEWLAAAVIAITASGITGAAVYRADNKIRVTRDLASPTPYIVGEAGPELFFPSRTNPAIRPTDPPA